MEENTKVIDFNKYPDFDNLTVFNQVKAVISVSTYYNEKYRNIKWVECPYCGYRSRCLSTHIKKIHTKYVLEHGKIECKIMCYESSHMSTKSGKNNPNSKENASELKRKQNSPKCIEFYEKRYPNATHEEHLEMLHKQYKKTRDVSLENNSYNSTFGYWLKKYDGDEDKARIAYKNRQATKRLEKFIKRYGEEEGKRRFNEMNAKWTKSINDKFKIKSEKEESFTHWLFFMFPELSNHTTYTCLTKQKRILKNGYHYRKPDILIDDKYIIEFYGDYTHGNPEIYNDDFIIKIAGSQSLFTAKEKQEDDKLRQKELENGGYKVLVIWENDFLNHKEKVKQQISEFLKDIL